MVPAAIVALAAVAVVVDAPVMIEGGDWLSCDRRHRGRAIRPAMHHAGVREQQHGDDQNAAHAARGSLENAQ
jgi:hypothetical protein